MNKYSIEDIMTYGIEEATPFHNFLGIKIAHIGKTMKLSLRMREQYIGNFTRKLLHGGVTATLLDLAGGSVVMYHTLREMADAPFEEQMARFARIGTIDLRIDYLRGGRGNEFFAAAELVRYGNRIAVTKMTLHNENELLIATGTGTYVVR